MYCTQSIIQFTLRPDNGLQRYTLFRFRRSLRPSLLFGRPLSRDPQPVGPLEVVLDVVQRSAFRLRQHQVQQQRSPERGDSEDEKEALRFEDLLRVQETLGDAEQ
uniref:(northern house mosquito) hypothetical protein n=1 Tax=Culex pipiens TaxID=7175 RepID=A0A8D8H8P1_CULPI